MTIEQITVKEIQQRATTCPLWARLLTAIIELGDKVPDDAIFYSENYLICELPYQDELNELNSNYESFVAEKFPCLEGAEIQEDEFLQYYYNEFYLYKIFNCEELGELGFEDSAVAYRNNKV